MTIDSGSRRRRRRPSPRSAQGAAEHAPAARRRRGTRVTRVSVGIGGVLVATALLYSLYSGSASATRDGSSDQPHDLEVPSSQVQVADATRRMHERLSAIADAADLITEELASVPAFGTNRPALIPALQAKIGDRLGEGLPAAEQLMLRYQIANQLLLAGRSKEALEVFESLQPLLASLTNLPAAQKRGEMASLHGAIGIAALRLGEQENCLLNHRATSCLFPIERAGVHTLPRGSRRAIEAFTAQLALDPENRGARWLLNLANMTVGEYPQSVPARWRIPPDAFNSEFDIRRFPDVSAGTGLDVVGLAGGCVLEDFDGDGDLDVMASSWGLRDQLRYFRNDGARGFVDDTKAAGLWGEWGGINLTHADYDNDGDADVFVHRGGWMGEAGRIPNSLLRNAGNGTFTDVTEAAGLLSFHPTHAAAWGDFDNDGALDLFVGNEDAGAGAHPVQLYRNLGNGAFEDLAPRVGLGVLGMVKGASWGDFNNDGRLDLYVSRFGKPNMLWRNDGRGPDGTWQFTDVAQGAGVEQPVLSFATWFWDYDNDGWLDIFVAGWDAAPVGVVASAYLGAPPPQGTPRLFRNKGDGTFQDVTTHVRLDRVLLSMGANFGDLDNDGFLDLYLGTGGPDLTSLVPNRMFRSAGGMAFQDVTTSGGFGHVQKGHGIAFGDIDNDGDQDVYAVLGGWFTGDVYQNALYENPGHGNHWIAITFEGTRSNRMGVGARVKVRVQTPRGAREIFRHVSDGGSFGSSPFQQSIGLGDATSIETIEVTWPVTGTVQVFRDVSLDRFVRIREGDGTVMPLPRSAFALRESLRRGPSTHETQTTPGQPSPVPSPR